MKYKNIVFGCQMNVHEAEKIAGMLESLGYSPTDITEEADVVVFITCCIRDTAERRALGNIGALKPLKKVRPDMIIAVCGCMSEQEGYDLMFKQKFPFVDIVLGTGNINLLTEKITEKRNNPKVKAYLNRSDTSMIDESLPVTRTSYPNAWVNIIYGCNNFCSYCIVPYVRGRERSRSWQSILDEVKSLIANGYKEITLLGQNVNSYGHDLTSEKIDFARLLEKIGQLEGKFRVRFMTSHPKDLTEEVADVMARYPVICNNIHLPLQAGSDEVLKNMNRRYTRGHYLSLIEMIRAKVPDCGITTDIMVGFPGESEEDFNDTLNIVKNVRFSNAFTFIYSMRKGTKAVEMPQVDSRVKRKRIGELIALQNRISKEIGEGYVGKVYEILIEDIAKADGSVCGRTDCGRLVTVKGGRELIGQFKNVLIDSSKSSSLYGNIVD